MHERSSEQKKLFKSHFSFSSYAKNKIRKTTRNSAILGKLLFLHILTQIFDKIINKQAPKNGKVGRKLDILQIKEKIIVQNIVVFL